MADSPTQVREAVAFLRRCVAGFASGHKGLYTADDADAIRTLLAAYTKAEADLAEAKEISRTLKANVEELRTQLSYARESLVNRAVAAEADLAEARKALEPFAAHGEAFEKWGKHQNKTGGAVSLGDNMTLLYGIEPDINLGHLRAARRALAAFHNKEE